MTFNPSFGTLPKPRRIRVPPWKRPLDFCLAGLAMLMFWPLFLAIAIIVRATSPGPAFFVQTRVGLNGRRFGMLKFRSMHVDAEARRAALVAASDRPGVCFKMKDDPRVTPFGRFLRRSSLDELPQLLNVLLGDMSLVGPRPALPEEVAAYPAGARARLAALPGITGVWQVSGRADVSFDDMVRMDVAYARGATLAGDLRILARTVAVVLAARGAY
ncbi:MAG: sugar transferase [Paracoccaceae bacterium]|nr:MAG: sugar transferase [Paracoccaceae bacterium]